MKPIRSVDYSGSVKRDWFADLLVAQTFQNKFSVRAKTFHKTSFCCRNSLRSEINPYHLESPCWDDFFNLLILQKVVNIPDIFSYASSSTLYPCQSVAGWAEFRTSVALRLASLFFLFVHPQEYLPSISLTNSDKTKLLNITNIKCCILNTKYTKSCYDIIYNI